MADTDQPVSGAADEAATDAEKERAALWDEVYATRGGKTDAEPDDPAEPGEPEEDDEPTDAPPDGDAGEGEADRDDDADDGAADDDPAELRRKLEQYEHRFKSEAGRQTAYQRRIEELERQLAAREAPPKPTPEQEKAREDRMKQLREDFPDVAEPLLEEIERMRGEHSAELKAIRAAQGAQQEATYRAEAAKLETAHPGYQDFYGQHKDAIHAWADTEAPVRVRDALYANLKELVNAEAAAEALTLFKRHAGIETPGETPPDGGKDKSLTARRERQKAAAASPRTPSPRLRSTGEPGQSATKQEWWDYWMRKRREEAGS